MANYVNNAELFAHLKVWLEEVAQAKLEGRPRPTMSEYLAECILLIATRVGTKANWINYSYKDDMISDAVLNVIRYLDRFNPTKSSNPFSYITQIVNNSFLRSLATEKKPQYTKLKLMEAELPRFRTRNSSQLADAESIRQFEEAKLRKKQESKDPSLKVKRPPILRGRKSSLSIEQKEEIQRRLKAGENATALAKEFGRARNTILYVRDKGKVPDVGTVRANSNAGAL